jgi:hypothetical protein
LRPAVNPNSTFVVSLTAMKRIGIEALACMVRIGYIKISFIYEFSFSAFQIIYSSCYVRSQVPNRFIIVIKGHKLECVVQATESDVC